LERWQLRTNIEIDDKLMRAAQRATGLKTKRATVEEALKLLVRLRRQKEVDKLFGKLKWEGDLEESRRDRFER
jgi:Arc/MetJ family transcription regulator